MDGGNIIEVNVANGVSIAVMALLGFVLLSVARKLVAGRRAAPVSTAPGFSGYAA